MFCAEDLDELFRLFGNVDNTAGQSVTSERRILMLIVLFVFAVVLSWLLVLYD